LLSHVLVNKELPKPLVAQTHLSAPHNAPVKKPHSIQIP
jgi:hypothetical protein